MTFDFQTDLYNNFDSRDIEAEFASYITEERPQNVHITKATVHWTLGFTTNTAGISWFTGEIGSIDFEYEYENEEEDETVPMTGRQTWTPTENKVEFKEWSSPQEFTIGRLEVDFRAGTVKGIV